MLNCVENTNYLKSDATEIKSITSFKNLTLLGHFIHAPNYRFEAIYIHICTYMAINSKVRSTVIYTAFLNVCNILFF